MKTYKYKIIIANNKIQSMDEIIREVDSQILNEETNKIRIIDYVDGKIFKIIVKHGDTVGALIPTAKEINIDLRKLIIDYFNNTKIIKTKKAGKKNKKRNKKRELIYPLNYQIYSEVENEGGTLNACITAANNLKLSLKTVLLYFKNVSLIEDERTEEMRTQPIEIYRFRSDERFRVEIKRMIKKKDTSKAIACVFETHVRHVHTSAVGRGAANIPILEGKKFYRTIPMECDDITAVFRINESGTSLLFVYLGNEKIENHHLPAYVFKVTYENKILDYGNILINNIKNKKFKYRMYDIKNGTKKYEQYTFRGRQVQKYTNENEFIQKVEDIFKAKKVKTCASIVLETGFPTVKNSQKEKKDMMLTIMGQKIRLKDFQRYPKITILITFIEVLSKPKNKKKMKNEEAAGTFEIFYGEENIKDGEWAAYSNYYHKKNNMFSIGKEIANRSNTISYRTVIKLKQSETTKRSGRRYL
ncbi:hypothetical protein ACFL56_00050 [Candidatus Margulisiibacteriota bacterium]